jgi:hypothetical protein
MIQDLIQLPNKFFPCTHVEITCIHEENPSYDIMVYGFDGNEVYNLKDTTVEHIIDSTVNQKLLDIATWLDENWRILDYNHVVPTYKHLLR